MSVILTTKGATHRIELFMGSSTTDPFDGLVFGKGNDEPTAEDTLMNLSQREEVGFILRVANDYPKRGDTDGRNPGRGADVFTWRFDRAASEPFVASNVAVTNYSNGMPIASAPMMVTAKQTIAQRFDERLIVWVNVPIIGSATIFTSREDAHEGRVQRVVGFVARNRALSGHPGGSVVDSTRVNTRPAPGQHVFTAADVVGLEGHQLAPENVVDFVLSTKKLVASTGQWTEFAVDEDLDCARHVSGAYIYADGRWTAAGGYNVAHSWIPPVGTREGTFLLTYTLTLCDDDIRQWSNVVEVR